MVRRDEIGAIAFFLGEPARALLGSALASQRGGRLEAAARIAADQVAKRPELGWCALLLALDAAELRLGGAVKILSPETPPPILGLEALRVERWGPTPFVATLYPEDKDVLLVLSPREGSLVLESHACMGLAARDPFVTRTVRTIAYELSAHLDKIVALELG